MEKKRILVVDDDEAVRRLLSAVLEKCEYEVHTSDNGREAVTRATTGRYDLVLLDLHMPRMDGGETLAELRRSPSTAHLPVLILSANTTRENILRAKAAGADDVLAKGCFKLENFLERIEASLEKSKNRAEDLPPWLNDTFQKLGIVPDDVMNGTDKKKKKEEETPVDPVAEGEANAADPASPNPEEEAAQKAS